jgi:hypothetical protein
MVTARRIPAPLRAINALIEETLTVRDLVDRQVWTFDPNQPAHEAYASMTAQDFDYAAVGPEPLMQFVSRVALKGAEGTVGEVAEPIPVRSCVDRSLPIGELFGHLEKRDHAFVLNGDHVRWIVTRADLNAPAVGVVVLAYLTAIEGGFRELARPMSGGQLLRFFNDPILEKIKELHDRKKRQNAAIGIHDCLTLGNWLHVVRNHPPFLEALGFKDSAVHRNETEDFESLRNSVAHGGRILDELGPEAALKGVRRVRHYAKRVWDAVDRQQPIWGTYLNSEIFTVKSGKESPLTGILSPHNLSQTPLHVITAWNPGSVGTDSRQNDIANRHLKKQLASDGIRDIRSGVGRSLDGAHAEDSFIVGGLTRQRAAAVGGLFGQAAIFELDDTTLRVIRCPDGMIMNERARRHTTGN